MIKTLIRPALMGTLLLTAGFAQKQDLKHNDPYLNGTPDENQIVKQVRHELLTLPYYGVFDDLGFNVQGGTVTLMGEVTQPTLQSDAEHAVKHVNGVTNVVNNIQVLPLSPMDDQIRRAEYHAIYGDPALATRYGFRALPSIHIIVKNGHVRLEGVVANKFDKDLVNTRANGVPNVFSVDNGLQIEASESK